MNKAKLAQLLIESSNLLNETPWAFPKERKNIRDSNINLYVSIIHDSKNADDAIRDLIIALKGHRLLADQIRGIINDLLKKRIKYKSSIANAREKIVDSCVEE